MIKIQNPVHSRVHIFKQQIHNDQGGHSLHHHHGSGNNHGVMAAPDFQGDGFSLCIDGFLLPENGRGGFSFYTNSRSTTLVVFRADLSPILPPWRYSEQIYLSFYCSTLASDLSPILLLRHPNQNDETFDFILSHQCTFKSV